MFYDKKRKKYTQEVRGSAVRLITEQGCQNAEAARDLGINPTMLGRWKREIEGGGADGSDPINTYYVHYCKYPGPGTIFGGYVENRRDRKSMTTSFPLFNKPIKYQGRHTELD